MNVKTITGEKIIKIKISSILVATKAVAPMPRRLKNSLTAVILLVGL